MDRTNIGDVTLDVYACTDPDCIEAGHPGHPGTVMRFPDGTEVDYPYGGVDRMAAEGLAGGKAGRQLHDALVRARERAGISEDEVAEMEATLRRLGTER